MNLKSLAVRSISGTVYCAIIVICILLGVEAVTIMLSVFGALAVIEFTKICSDLSVRRIPTLLLDIAGIICLCFTPIYIFPILLWLAVMVCRFIEELYIKDPEPIRNLAHSMMNQIYIGIPLASAAGLASWFGSSHILLLVFLFLWINDTGAFLVGCTIGKHRLFERISPKKSWEGFWGGVVINLIAAALLCTYCNNFFELPQQLWIWLSTAAIVSIFGTFGDLVESLIKRSLHIKDSGNIIPGHGGILDRIDSLLLAAPAVLLFLFMVI